MVGGQYATRAPNCGTGRGDHLAEIAEAGESGTKFGSVRRVLKVLDLARRREGLTAKLLAWGIGASLSTCYYLINILNKERYLEKVSSRHDYKIAFVVDPDGYRIGLVERKTMKVGEIIR